MHGYGEAEKEVIRPEFNRSVLIDFKGAKITSDAGVIIQVPWLGRKGTLHLMGTAQLTKPFYYR